MSFRLKTIIGIAAIEAVFLMILVFSSLSLLESSNRQEIERRAIDTVELLSSMVKDAVISSDLARLEAIASEMVERDQIAYVQIWGKDQLLSEKYITDHDLSETTDFAIHDVNDGIFDIEASLEEAGYNFGRVRIGVVVSELDAFISVAQHKLTFIAFIEMILVAIFSYVLGSYLTRSLMQLRQAAQDISQGGSNVLIDVKGQDEVAETAKAFNSMSESLTLKAKQLNQALSKSREDKALAEESLVQARALLDIALDGIVSIDADGLIHDVNPAGSRLMKQQRTDIIGKNILDYLTSDDSVGDQEVSQILRPCQHIVFNLLQSNGNLCPIELSITPLKSDRQKQFICLIRDMTEKYARQKEIEDKNAIHKAIIQSSLDAIISIDSFGFIREFGPSAETLLGYTKEEILGKTLEETIIPHSMRAAHSHKLANHDPSSKEGILNNRIEVEALHKDGHLIPIEMMVSPLEVNGARLFTAFIRDISQRLEHEHEMKDALEQAKAGSEEKSRFLATMSHEIRSPLNAVLGSMDLLQDTPLSPEQRLYTKTTKDAGRALLSLINDILDFSKIEAGLLELDLHRFSIEDMLDQIMQIAYPKAKNKGLELAYVLDKHIPMEALGDVARLRQVIINLVDNAIKFSESGTIQILVSMTQLSDSQSTLHVEVIDPGLGVPMDKRKDLFEEFTQVDASHSTKYGGAGLGLAICRRIVELMKGKIGIDMEREQGSRFYFDVLLEEIKEVQSIRASEDVSRSLAMIHNDPVFRDSVTQQLAMYGVDIESYPDIRACLEDEQATPRDIILFDENLLDKHVTDACEKLKSTRLKNQGQLVLLKAELRHDRSNEQLIDLQVLKPLSRAKLLALAGLGADEEISIQTTEQSSDSNVFKGAKILLAEDSAANQMVATTMLRQAGYSVDVANNGQEALDAVNVTQYDLVLMDMRMPNMDGLTAARLIREQPDHTALPIIALTANAQKEDVENCLSAGMNAFLSKPIRKSKLLETINRFLSKSLNNDQLNKNPEEDIAPSEMVAATNQNVKIFNMETLSALGEETSFDVLPSIVESFVEDCEQRLKRIAGKQSKVDLVVIGDEAHTIKSSSALFGLEQMHDLAKQLEAACNEAKLDDVPALVASLLAISQKSFTSLSDGLRTCISQA